MRTDICKFSRVSGLKLENTKPGGFRPFVKTGIFSYTFEELAFLLIVASRLYLYILKWVIYARVYRTMITSVFRSGGILSLNEGFRSEPFENRP